MPSILRPGFTINEMYSLNRVLLKFHKGLGYDLPCTVYGYTNFLLIMIQPHHTSPDTNLVTGTIMLDEESYTDYNRCMTQFVERTPNSSLADLTEGYIFSGCNLHYCEDEDQSGTWHPKSYQMCLLPIDYTWGLVRRIVVSAII